MRAPLSWIREYTDCELPVEDIANRFTMAGLEVEAIERNGAWSEHVAIAEVLSTTEHSRARDLRIVELGIGGDRKVVALTAAPNITAGSSGSKVAAALPGALLIDAKAEGFALREVEERELLGTTSQAVLCSARELGLGDDHSGVLILPDDAPVGAPLSTFQQPPADAECDVVLEIAILPNYGRCLSIIGLARELAALTRSSFRVHLDAVHLPKSDNGFPVRIDAPDLCARYSACVLEGLEVRPSPSWMARRLVLAGLKPINNLVDVTNYILLELGQPMHAFDLEQLPHREISVRRARPGETMYTLDQVVQRDTDGTVRDGSEAPRELDGSILVISSGDQAVAVAGVIGGLDSQIEPDTRNVLLESANFDPVSVRKAMMHLKVTTDSSLRFSRNVDPSLTVLAIQRALHLLADSAGAPTTGEITDCYPHPAESRQIHLSASEVRRILGMPLETTEIRSALERLGFAVQLSAADSDALDVDVPGFRSDVTIAADLAEEVIRVIGFDRLAPKRLVQPLPHQRRNVAWELRKRVRAALVGAGLQDVITYSLTTADVESRLSASSPEEAASPSHLRIVNPSSQDRSVLRRTLVAGLLEVAARNHRHRDRIALFEIGPVFHPEGRDGPLPGEPWRLGIVLTGPVRESSWMETRPRSFGLFDLKGIVENVLGELHVAGHRFVRSSEAPYHPGVAAELRIGDAPIGTLGQLHPVVRDAFDLGERTVIAAELDLEHLFRAARFEYPYRPLMRFPPLRQDLALVVDDDVPSEKVLAAIRDAAGPLLVGARLFDLYRGEQLGGTKKSLAFELTFAAPDRSLEEEEVNRLRDGMLGRLEQAVGARIR